MDKTQPRGEAARRASPRLHPARRQDRWLILRRILGEGLDPTKLNWRRFVVAEDDEGRVVGFAQMKELGAGVREFGSLVVEPERRGQGVGGALIAHFLDTSPHPIYLLCGLHNVNYYRRFGFRRLQEEEMPAPLRRKWRRGRFFARLLKTDVAAMAIG